MLDPACRSVATEHSLRTLPGYIARACPRIVQGPFVAPTLFPISSVLQEGTHNVNCRGFDTRRVDEDQSRTGTVTLVTAALRLLRQRTRSTVLGMIVLMRFFRLTERPSLLDRRHNVAAKEALGFRNLIDEPSRFLPLKLICDEDGRPVLRTHVGPLSVELRRIVELEEPLHQFLVPDFLRVEAYAYGLRMSAQTGAHLPVRGVGRFTAHVSGHGMNDAGNLLKAILDAPEAAAGKISGMRLDRP